MKKIFIAILLSFTVGLFAQKPTVKKVKIYGVSWEARLPTYPTIRNIKKKFHYSLILKEIAFSFDDLFYDYKSCKELLMSQDTISFCSYRPSYKDRDCVACVKLYFGIKTITIYFRSNGEYCFQGIYYKANKELYYCIFSFFIGSDGSG